MSKKKTTAGDPAEDVKPVGDAAGDAKPAEAGAPEEGARVEFDQAMLVTPMMACGWPVDAEEQP